MSLAPCCARSRRFAVERISEDSGYDSYESTGASAKDDNGTVRGKTARWLVTETAARTTGGGLRAVVALRRVRGSDGTSTTGVGTMAAAIEAGSLLSGSRTSGMRRRMYKV